jgi:hypothetical protein
MISPRFAAPVAALVGLALVPTVIHSYRGVTVDDGLRATAVAATLDGMVSSPTTRRDTWVWNTFQARDWTERVYRAGPHDVTLFVGRSFDAKRLYHHPELALLRGHQTVPSGVHHVAARPDVPLHVLRTTRNGVPGLAVYALRYQTTYIDRPVLFQLRTSASLLVSGRKPLTLFLASAGAGTIDRLDEAPATRVLLGAIESFEQQQAAGGAAVLPGTGARP